MFSFPRGIEDSLRDAGMNDSEILVLRHLIAGDAYTLRTLASRAGKSTGTVDIAVKKLVRRKVVSREMINDVPTYLIHSLDSIMACLRKHTKEQEATLRRRLEDFRTYIGNLDIPRSRPDLSHFEGEEGVKAAYKKLLTQEIDEMLCYLPLVGKEEEHPLHGFYAEYAKERKQREIFLRVLTSDTEWGRRYQCRDAFLYRQTTLVPKEKLGQDIERIIAGEMMAFVDHAQQRATVLWYPQLAEVEKRGFEALL